MGLDINAFRILDLLNEEEQDYDGWVVYIDKNVFDPIEHNSVFALGQYKADKLQGSEFSLPYSSYGRFRRCLCSMANNCEPEYFWDNDIDNFKDIPFIEIINFSDCEGVMDYLTAQNLYEDFILYENKITDLKKKGQCDFNFREKYQEYMGILKSAIDNKGIVYYH